ncbi:MAG: hydroxylamine reductase, partial [Bacteroidetes bacterium]|nr:hydroxylamine reductase [Bacteroidota bacterium]
MSMFCYQCQEAAKGVGCEKVGVCGKQPEVAVIQDMLIYVAKGVSVYAHAGFKNGIRSKEADLFVFDALFTTITNANFDYVAIRKKVMEGFELRDSLRKIIEAKGIKFDEA